MCVFATDGGDRAALGGRLQFPERAPACFEVAPPCPVKKELVKICIRQRGHPAVGPDEGVGYPRLNGHSGLVTRLRCNPKDWLDRTIRTTFSFAQRRPLRFKLTH